MLSPFPSCPLYPTATAVLNTFTLTQSRPRRSVACHCHSDLALDLADFQADVELGALDRLAALLHLATTSPEPPAGLLVRCPAGAWLG